MVFLIAVLTYKQNWISGEDYDLAYSMNKSWSYFSYFKQDKFLEDISYIYLHIAKCKLQ